jgi:hypothetical protein
MWVNPTLCERGGTIEITVVTLLVAMGPDDITRMVVVAVALSSNRLLTSTVTHRCYQMITIAIGEDMILRKTVATDATTATVVR